MTGPRRPVLPLVVGISGKRNLRGRDDAVRTALTALFDRIDEQYTHTDKILLTGLAEGADMLAAEAALGRPQWRVVATLPLEAALFSEDFAEGATDHPEKLQDFDRLLADARLIQRPLKPLRDRPHGKPLTAAALHRSPPEKMSNPQRTAHYEQLGLFLARHCGLLIAVMDRDEKAGRLGGTGRVVRQRLEGAPDPDAEAIIARSDELIDASPLDDPATGPVWQIDLADPDPSSPDALIVRLPKFTSPEAGLDRLEPSLVGAKWIETLNRRTSALSEADWAKIEARVGNGAGGAGTRLGLCRFAAAAIQREKMGWLRRSVGLMALLFLVAIASYEMFVELKPYEWSRWMSWAYLGAVLGAVMVYLFAARQHWQRIAEEYRAFSEALRVQLVWWGAGLTGPGHRVDDLHLSGFHTSHAEVRIAIGQAITAALLTGDPPEPRPREINKWLDEQSDFFKRRADTRRRAVRLTEESSWFLFAVSIGAAICLALMQTRFIGLFAPFYSGGWEAIVGFALLVALLFGFVHTSRCFVHEEEPVGRIRLVWATARSGSVFAGILVALSLCALAGLLPEGDGGGHARAGEPSFTNVIAVDLVAIAVILPAAISGTIRFIAEKLSWVTELHAYEESRDRFARGSTAFNSATSVKRKRAILMALGMEAVRENEAWLRAHRERPLEPVVGG
jgi:hypothetical protein